MLCPREFRPCSSMTISPNRSAHRKKSGRRRAFRTDRHHRTRVMLPWPKHKLTITMILTLAFSSRGECATEEGRTLIGLKFSILRRVNIRQLKPGQSLHEHGLIFGRLADGSYRARVMVYGNLSVYLAFKSEYRIRPSRRDPSEPRSQPASRSGIGFLLLDVRVSVGERMSPARCCCWRVPPEGARGSERDDRVRFSL